MSKPLTPAEHSHLWDAFRSGNREAFGQLYDFYAADLYRYGYNLVRNRPLVEDAIHELFLHLHQNRTRLGPTDNIRFYLYRALRRRLLDMVARLNRFDDDDCVFEGAAFQVVPLETHLVEQQLASQQQALLMVEVNKLPRRQREVLYLLYMKGLTYQQTAEVMGLALKSVYNTVNVALSTLRIYVRDSFEQSGAFWSVSLTAFIYSLLW